MGVPKFFRWLSERYPLINQRAGYPPNKETCLKHFQTPPPEPLEPPDPVSTCGLPPPIDRLYIDTNGIIHGCSHNNSSNNSEDNDDINNNITNEEIFRNVCYYLDRIVGDIVRPTELVYLAIDGVAPRAKLNQQRARRYRSGREGEIEQTLHEAHVQQAIQENEKQQQQFEEMEEDPQDMGFGSNIHANYNSSSSSATTEALHEVEPGRYAGKFETHPSNADAATGDDDADATPNNNDDHRFHSHSITPGTEFFQECTAHLQHFVKYKLTHDPKWKHLTVIFSGPNVPGEGEHKIMSFLRNEQQKKDYNPNLRHCIMGQDGDLIMLGLVTHEPNLVLLRERVVFDLDRQRLLESEGGVSQYIHNPHFEWLHMNILREYLAYEFETSCVVSSHPYELEATVDDFVFLTFFVGNDFLPHMPALDIGDEAFELLFYSYKRHRSLWQRDKTRPPYLTHAGNIVSGKRLQHFLQLLGDHESPYYDNKRRESRELNEKRRTWDLKQGFTPRIPSDEVLESKEQSDRANYREMLQSIDPLEATSKADETTAFAPVLSGSVVPTFKPSSKEEEDIEEGVLARMENLLQYSVSTTSTTEGESDGGQLTFASFDDRDLKGRYYWDKFNFTPFDAEKHIALRKAYMKGLVWNLKYYYEGCVSWDWYYPYHYGPMLSDLVNLDQILDEISFDELGEPLSCFEQLMGCMPPSSAYLLPEPYRKLLTDSSSPISDFYPRNFVVDMNGKRAPWEAVVLLPFIDSNRLIEAAKTIPESMLSEKEKERNTPGEAVVFTHNENVNEDVEGIGEGEGFTTIENCKASTVPFLGSKWDDTTESNAVFRPEVAEGVIFPQPGFPSLKSVPIESLSRRRIGINVFGLRSRYRTAILDLCEDLPTFPPAELLASKLIGTTVYFNYPSFLEGFVTAVSNTEMSIRGKNGSTYFKTEEIATRKQMTAQLTKQLRVGEKLTGTGGWRIPSNETTLSIRPLKKVKILPNGSKVKTYARFEVEVPLVAAVWAPLRKDPRIVTLPARLEKDPYFADRAFSLNGSRTMLSETTPSTTIASQIIRSDLSSKLPSVTSVLPDYVEPDVHETMSTLPPLPGKVDRAVTSSRPSKIESVSPLPDIGAVSRGFATLASRNLTPLARRDLPKHVRPPIQKLAHSTAARSYLKGKGVNGRGKLFLLGTTAIATVLFGSRGVQAGHTLSSSMWQTKADLKTFSSFLQCLVGFRGGDQELFQDLESAYGPQTVSPPPLEFAHGTTTLSFVFKGGIVVAVDSRASIGNFVGSKTTQKVLPINTHILGTMAGGAADCSYWIRKLKAEAQLHFLSEGKRMTVARASRLLSNALYDNRGLNLSVGTMVMGFDPANGGPRIYYVDNSGVRIEGDAFAVGSGSTFAWGILDTERRFEMSEEEAIALGLKAIRHATFRDAYSGGFINVYLITKDGWKKVFGDDLARSSVPVAGTLPR